MNNMIKNRGTREIKQIKERNIRHVTFSKRRVGLFKKASELCIVTGAKCAIICESFGKRVFAFGHPSVESVVEKYRGDTSSDEVPDENNSDETDVINSPCMHEELKKQHLEIVKEIEIEKNKLENAKEGDLFWWQQPFDHLEVEELEIYVSSMEKLMNNLRSRADDLMVIKSSASMLDANKAVNSNVSGLSDENLANKNLVINDDELPDGFLDEFFAMKELNFNDDGLDEYLDDIELQNYNVQAPNAYRNTGNEVQYSHINGNLAVPDVYRNAADLHHFDTRALPNDFGFFHPPN